MVPAKPVTRRGFVLLISISVLALLALLASSFAMMSRMERSVSRNYVDKARAKLLAQSGVERAIQDLRAHAESQPWDELGGAWAYRDGPGIPIEYCTVCSYPAFQIPVANPPVPLTVAGNLPPNFSLAANTNSISGALEATYDQGWDVYVDKVLDTASQIDLNMSNPDFATILTNLGAALPAYLTTINFAARTGIAVPNPVLTPTDVSNIVTLRTRLGGAFGSKSDLLINDTITRNKLTCLQDFVCVNCYRDTQAVLPAPNSAFPAGSYAPATPSAGWIGRAPMNINTAPWPVLVAWVQSVRGYQLAPRAAGATYMPIPFQNPKPLSAALTQAQAGNIAKSIVSHRINHPFRTLDDIVHFIQNPYNGAARLPGGSPVDPWNGYDLATDGTVGITSAQAAALIANANPNLTTNKYFENSPTWNSVDKCDLTNYTWEACCSSMGYYEIESLGRVLPPNPGWPGTTPPTLPSTGNPPLNVAAEAKVKTVVRLYSVYRQTTQKDFVTGGGPWGPGALSPTLQTLPEKDGSTSSTEGALTMRTVGTPAGTSLAPAGSAFMGTSYAWDSPAIAGESTVTTNRNPGLLSAGGDLLPDGGLAVANSPKQLTYQINTILSAANLGNLLSQGGVEFWVRLLNPASVGNGEPLLYLATTGSVNGKQYQGACVKIEHFGNSLYCTRIVWGYPQPSQPPYYFITNVYQTGNITGWHPGTWHHLAVEWQDYIPPYKNMQITPVDGAFGVTPIYGNDVATWEATSPEQKDLWFWVDGVQQGGFWPRWAPSATYYFGGGSSFQATYKMLLVSKTPPPGFGNPAIIPTTTIDLGGYTTKGNGQQMDYVSGAPKLMPNGNLTLYSNCVFDHLKVYGDALTWGHAVNNFTPPSRYSTATPPQYSCSFDFSSLLRKNLISQNAVLGTVSWQTRQPAFGVAPPPTSNSLNSAEMALWPTNNGGSADWSPFATCTSWTLGSYNAGNTGGATQTYGVAGTSATYTDSTCPSAGAYPLNYLAINKPIGTNPTFTYQLTFQNTNNLPFSAAPVVEELQVTIIDAPRFESWEVHDVN